LKRRKKHQEIKKYIEGGTHDLCSEKSSGKSPDISLENPRTLEGEIQEHFLKENSRMFSWKKSAKIIMEIHDLNNL
jgi:hypothetical protein